MKNPAGSFWPSEQQRLLLTAALASSDEAARAWRAARPNLSLDELELGSFALLPLVHRNLMAAGEHDTDLSRLKGIYRRSWTRNQLLLDRTLAVDRALASDDVRATFVEGVAMAARFYDELGLRPTSVIDILVDPGEHARAIAALGDAGWDVRTEPIPGPSRELLLFHDDGAICLLRTALAVDVAGGALSRQTWQLRSGEHGEVPVLSPTDTLLATCVLHARVQASPNVQWIVDAKLVVRAGVDWDRLLVLASTTGQAPRLRDALLYLSRLPGSVPPPEVCAQLAAMPTTRRHRFAYGCSIGATKAPARLSALVGEHVAATYDRSLFGVASGFPGYLRDRWNLERTWHVPVAAARRSLRLLATGGRTAR